MMALVCDSSSCRALFRAVGEPHELAILFGPGSEFYPDQYICPSCGGKAAMRSGARADEAFAQGGRPVRVLEAAELFRAQYGLGLPEEQECSREVIEGYLRKYPIRKVAGHSIGGRRSFCLEFLELEDGTRLYFGASTHGAVVYRIARPVKHTDQVLKELEHADP